MHRDQRRIDSMEEVIRVEFQVTLSCNDRIDCIAVIIVVFGYKECKGDDLDMLGKVDIMGDGF